MIYMFDCHEDIPVCPRSWFPFPHFSFSCLFLFSNTFIPSFPSQQVTNNSPLAFYINSTQKITHTHHSNPLADRCQLFSFLFLSWMSFTVKNKIEARRDFIIRLQKHARAYLCQKKYKPRWVANPFFQVLSRSADGNSSRSVFISMGYTIHWISFLHLSCCCQHMMMMK